MRVNITRGLIQEFDMKSAGLSVLTEKGYISEEMFLTLSDANKLDRNIALGKAIIGETGDIVGEEVKKYVDEFIRVNNLKPSNILEIAKDAIFTYNVNPKILEFGDHIVFRPKARYFLMIEFPVSENNRNTLKLYKKYAGVHLRGGKLNTNHEGYYALVELVNSLANRSTTTYFKTLKNFIITVRRSKDNLISNVTNEHIINVFKEISL